MACTQTCKFTCITGYLIAAIAALVWGYNYFVNADKQIIVPKPVAIAYIVGGLITLWCGVRWALRAEGSAESFAVASY